MALYAIGDVQGCYDSLRHLLDKLAFEPGRDQIWFTGDLVNRGPKSLDVLRFVKDLGNAAITVLGNHDLHLLAVAAKKRRTHRKDTLDEVLAASDADELLDWLRHRPLLFQREQFCLLHAGLPPQWDLTTSRACASEVEAVLRGDGYLEFFEHMYGDLPDLWSPDLRGWGRLRFITNCLTRMRCCDSFGRVDLKYKGTLAARPAHLLPWFSFPGRLSQNASIVFGHWSALGFYADSSCYCLDSGCLWGGELTALRLDGDMCRVSVACPALQSLHLL